MNREQIIVQLQELLDKNPRSGELPSYLNMQGLAWITSQEAWRLVRTGQLLLISDDKIAQLIELLESTPPAVKPVL